MKASNVIFLGYVDTKNGKRASSAITQDIATYAGWESAYAVAGIFFDDVTATKKLFSDYSGWAATAKSSFNGGNGLVWRGSLALDWDRITDRCVLLGHT